MALIVPTIKTMAQGPQTPWNGDNDGPEAREYAEDPKDFLLTRCATAMNNGPWARDLVVCATYYLPAFEVLPNGHKWWRSQTEMDEALYQGKVGLIIGMGPLAFVDDGNLRFGGAKYEIGDWVQWDIHDARQFTVDRIHCRWMKDVQIIRKVNDPKLVY